MGRRSARLLTALLVSVPFACSACSAPPVPSSTLTGRWQFVVMRSATGELVPPPRDMVLTIERAAGDSVFGHYLLYDQDDSSATRGYSCAPLTGHRLGARRLEIVVPTSDDRNSDTFMTGALEGDTLAIDSYRTRTSESALPLGTTMRFERHPGADSTACRGHR